MRSPAALLILALTGCQHAREDWWRHAVFYEIFVRSYADGDGDGTGDLPGLTQKLDTLTALGVDALWLMPIHPSPSYHGYDVTDYRGIHPDFGGIADFDALIAEAHARGIRVILDYVLNHASREHPAFEQRRDWFVWRDDDPGWRQPWGNGPVWHPLDGRYYYAIFWSGMPDWNFARAEVEAEHLANLQFWRSRGVDGFRIDAARHLFESDEGELSDRPQSPALIQRMRSKLPGTLLVAEAWTAMETAHAYRGAFDLAFGFDTAGAIKTAVNDGARADFVQLQARAEQLGNRDFEAPFLSNHDMTRVMRSLGGDMRKMRAAAATLFALPGTPFIYYGEEIGMLGGPGPGDEDKRTKMEWDEVAKQKSERGSLWSLYRDLIALRHREEGLRTGATSRPELIGAGPSVTALLRGDVLFVVNFAKVKSGPFSVKLDREASVLFPEGVQVDDAIRFPDGLDQFVFLKLSAR